MADDPVDEKDEKIKVSCTGLVSPAQLCRAGPVLAHSNALLPD